VLKLIEKLIRAQAHKAAPLLPVAADDERDYLEDDDDDA
jgi:hypothetical protein